MKLKVVVLGAGFGGLELSSILSETIGENLDLTLIDKSDAFYFGFSKLDVMFGFDKSNAVKLNYTSIVKPGVKFLREIITEIDPEKKRVTTLSETLDADILVIALGADYDLNATPGLIECGNEFYTMEGAEILRDKITAFTKGNVIVGVTSAPFKCPPAPSEAALMMHDNLVKRGLRSDCEISLVMPFGMPIPPSPDSSKALIKVFKERDISFIPERKISSLDCSRSLAVLDDNTEMKFDLFLGIPKHCVPEVVKESGLNENGWIPVDRKNLKTRFPGVYAIGDVTSVGTPKAGVFAEGAARVAAASIISEYKNIGDAEAYAGAGSCYIEFGEGKVGRVDVDFFSGPEPKGIHNDASEELSHEKKLFASSRKARWFGKPGD